MFRAAGGRILGIGGFVRPSRVVRRTFTLDGSHFVRRMNLLALLLLALAAARP